MTIENYTYTKEDGSSSQRKLLMNASPPPATLLALDMTEADETTTRLIEHHHAAYRAEQVELMAKLPTFKQYLEAKNVKVELKYRSFKVSGLKKL